MAALDMYAIPEQMPHSDSTRIARLLGIKGDTPLNDLDLADKVSGGLRVKSVRSLSDILGKRHVVGVVITEPTLRRAQNSNTQRLSREMSERLYEISRVVDLVGRLYNGDRQAMTGFLTRSHPLLDGRTPLQVAQSSSAGAEAVMNMLRRVEVGVVV